mmetsp:Transcript_16865/g.48648  ORF Transcript_16865/g.48648 Transcript_16865/m.48648 type:complete len:231 (-) Transcript_16865:32-724(-)
MCATAAFKSTAYVSVGSMSERSDSVRRSTRKERTLPGPYWVSTNESMSWAGDGSGRALGRGERFQWDGNAGTAAVAVVEEDDFGAHATAFNFEGAVAVAAPSSSSMLTASICASSSQSDAPSSPSLSSSSISETASSLSSSSVLSKRQITSSFFSSCARRDGGLPLPLFAGAGAGAGAGSGCPAAARVASAAGSSRASVPKSVQLSRPGAAAAAAAAAVRLPQRRSSPSL